MAYRSDCFLWWVMMHLLNRWQLSGALGSICFNYSAARGLFHYAPHKWEKCHFRIFYLQWADTFDCLYTSMTTYSVIGYRICYDKENTGSVFLILHQAQHADTAFWVLPYCNRLVGLVVMSSSELELLFPPAIVANSRVCVCRSGAAQVASRDLSRVNDSFRLNESKKQTRFDVRGSMHGRFLPF